MANPKTCPSTCVTTSNFVVLEQRVFTDMERNSKNWGSTGNLPLGEGAWLTPKYKPSPYVLRRQIWYFCIKGCLHE